MLNRAKNSAQRAAGTQQAQGVDAPAVIRAVEPSAVDNGFLCLTCLKGRYHCMAIGMHSQSGLDDVGYLTSDELLDIRDQPNSLLILGGQT